MFKLKMLPVMRETFEGVLKIGRYWAGAGLIELRDPETGTFWADRADGRMWGRIILRSAVSRGGLESTTAAAAWIDEGGQEAFNIGTWEAVLRRLSLYQGRALVTTTLYNHGGWLKMLYDQWKKHDPDIDVIQFSSTQNPAFTQAEFERAKRSMQEHRFKLFYLGQFTAPPGQIYNLPPAQIISRFAIPNHWPRYVGVDFGAVNTALIWLAEDERNNRYIAYRESLDGGKTTEEHAKTTLETAGRENVVGFYGGAPSETQQRMDWSNEGVPIVRPLVADFEPGIDRVTSLIKNKRLFVFDDMDGLLGEINEYSREMDDNGNVFDSVRDRNKYHRADALRYVSTALVNGDVTYGANLYD